MASKGVADERTALRNHINTASKSKPNAPSPLQRTPTSDYLVLTRVDSYNQVVQLPRPRFWYILPIFGVLDAAYTVSSAAAFGVQGKNEILMVVWGLCRAVATIGLTCHRRVREVGWVIVGCAMISALAALAELNLIIQRKAFTSTIPATLALYCFSHLFFGLLHWIAFATIVGISRDRNPYGLGLHSVRRRPGAWREGVANISVRRSSLVRNAEEEDEYMDGLDADENAERDEEWENRLRRKRNALEESFASDEELDGITEEEDDLEDESSEDEDDVPIDATLLDYDEDQNGDHEEQDTDNFVGSPPRLNDIIDIIPSPSTATGTRHRTVSQSKSLRSRRSFYARASTGNSPEDGLGNHNQLSSEPSPISPMSGYGTFRSLAGI